jgi:hypothetical protein
MPLELQIIRASEFIRVGTPGKLDFNSSREVLRQLAAACRRRGIHRALLDVRDLVLGPTPMLAPGELASLVNTFREIGFTHEQRLAVLYSADPHRGARLFAFIGALRGWTVEAFSDFEEALDWLSTEEPSELPAKAVPVRLSRTARNKTTRENHPTRPH